LMCVEDIACNISVVFFRHSVYSNFYGIQLLDIINLLKSYLLTYIVQLKNI